LKHRRSAGGVKPPEQVREDGAVALDWDRIGTGDSEALLRPRDIYAGLASRPWPYLRHEQGEVLDKWFERRDDHDVVIKQNTGGGKTAVGLLIAQSTLNEGIGKAVYLTPDNYLVKQVREEAAKLNIATTDDPYDPAFTTAQAVLVTNYQKLLNGMSAFGVVGDGKEPIDLGIVVVDDAHAALARTEDQFRLRVPASHEAYGKLLELFAHERGDAVDRRARGPDLDRRRRRRRDAQVQHPRRAAATHMKARLSRCGRRIFSTSSRLSAHAQNGIGARALGSLSPAPPRRGKTVMPQTWTGVGRMALRTALKSSPSTGSALCRPYHWKAWPVTAAMHSNFRSRCGRASPCNPARRPPPVDRKPECLWSNVVHPNPLARTGYRLGPAKA
jgi:hypothetical protein